MGFAIALDLCGLVQFLPLGAALCPALVECFAITLFHHRKHDAVGQVAVVCNGQYVAAGFLLILFQPGPQVAWGGAALGRARGKGDHTATLVAAVAIHHDPVHIVAMYQGGPFVTDKGGKAPRLVIAFSGVYRFGPGVFVLLRVRCVDQAFREVTLGEQADQFQCHAPTLAGLDTVIPVFTCRVGQDMRRTG